MKATFGMGCFWHSEEVFTKVKGVTKTTVGFMGGKVKNPPYLLVCTGLTGHAEVVQLEYDPKKVSYKELLKIYFENHDPTQLNRQEPDVGTQYRSVIFYHNEEQRKEAQAYAKKIKGVVTQIMPASNFYKAGEKHQKYYEKRK